MIRQTKIGRSCVSSTYLSRLMQLKSDKHDRRLALYPKLCAIFILLACVVAFTHIASWYRLPSNSYQPCRKDSLGSLLNSITGSDATFLTRAMYEDVHASPGLVKLSSLGTAFLATPWLLPEAAASEVLEYRGHHNSLDRLLAIQAKSLRDILGQAAEATEPERTSKGAVTVVFYNFSHTLLLQNWVYSAVRWAGITNYIVVTWEEESLSACLEMYLPCFNASSYSPIPMNSSGDARRGDASWISITWIKALITQAISDRGFHVHSSDVDVAFAPKAFWPSMLQFLIPTNSDIAMQRDLWGPVNTGCVVLRPNKYSRAYMANWVAAAKDNTRDFVSNQKVAIQLGKDTVQICEGARGCKKLAQQREADDLASNGSASPHWAIIRRFHSAWDPIYQTHCAGPQLEWLAPVDPCQPGVSNYHMICVTGAKQKEKGFKAAGLWFLDDTATLGCTSHPLNGLPQSTGRQVFEEGAQAGGASDAGVQRYARRSLKAVSMTTAPERQMALRVLHENTNMEPTSNAHMGRNVARCRPLHWRNATTEAAFAFCDKQQLSWVAYPQTLLAISKSSK